MNHQLSHPRSYAPSGTEPSSSRATSFAPGAWARPFQRLFSRGASLTVAFVAAALLALLHPLAHGAYNVGSGVATPIGDVVELLADQLGADAQTVLSLPSRRAPGPGVLVADNRRLRSLGWTQRLTLQQALARSIAAPTSGSWRAQHAS